MNESEYENLRQQLQVDMTQKQTFQLQYNEIKRTLEELGRSSDSEKIYEMVGQILIKKDKKEIESSLKEKLDILEFRLKSIEKAVNETTKRLQEAQKELSKQ
ncbi:MAG: prefoldin subunit [Candidatus Parvarchaeota archaeon]|nr:prefoldin subunit [Candidatus Parvarchaeota archaeon]